MSTQKTVEEQAFDYADKNSSFSDCPMCNNKFNGLEDGFKHGYSQGKLEAERVAKEEIERLKAENDKFKTVDRLYKELISEWNEDCEESCDSYAHSDNCGMADLGVAKRKLKNEITEIEKKLNIAIDALYEINHVTIRGLKQDAEEGIRPRDWGFYASRALKEIGEIE